MPEVPIPSPRVVAGLLGARAPQLVPDAPDGADGRNRRARLHVEDLSVRVRNTANKRRNSRDSAHSRPASTAGSSGRASYGRRYPRVLVAADQLDQARAIAAQPIPQEIIDDSKTEIAGVSNYPYARSAAPEDPILEAIEPANHWRCEAVRTRMDRTSRKCQAEKPESPETQRHKTERAARQQGSSFLRENSSNGGKPDRTFWLHTRFGGKQCQGKTFAKINSFCFNSLTNVFGNLEDNASSLCIRLLSSVIYRDFTVFLRVYVQFSTAQRRH